MIITLKSILGWLSQIVFELFAKIDKFPGFMKGNLIELLGVLIASVLVAVFSTLYIDKKREVQKVKARVLDMRLEQYNVIRSFFEEQSKTITFPENVDDIKNNLANIGLMLDDNDECYCSQGISTEQKVKKVLDKLETLVMRGLYILDDDVLGMLLQIKIYIMNLNIFSIILNGYYDNKKNNNKITLDVKRKEEIAKDKKLVQTITSEDIIQISDFYYHNLSILLNNEYQKMIEKLQKMLMQKSSKPKFERKEKNYRKIRTRQRLQKKALRNKILKSKFPQLIMALASFNSAYFQETDEQREKTIKIFLDYSKEILEWKDKGKLHNN